MTSLWWLVNSTWMVQIPRGWLFVMPSATIILDKCGPYWCRLTHDDVIKWKHFSRYWPFVRGIHRWPVNSPAQRPVTRSFDVFFDLRLNKRLSKQSWGWWFETPSCSLWRAYNVWSPAIVILDIVDVLAPTLRYVISNNCVDYSWRFLIQTDL